MTIRVKRVYEGPEAGDGMRFLVDRLWPRGIKKEELKMDGWLKDAAPSDSLRQWFAHDPARWPEFCSRYNAELEENLEALRPILEMLDKSEITLLYAAHDTEHNNAVALRMLLEARIIDPGKR